MQKGKNVNKRERKEGRNPRPKEGYENSNERAVEKGKPGTSSRTYDTEQLGVRKTYDDKMDSRVA